jgi:hypothetical protein
MFNFSLAVGLSQSGKLSAAWQGYKIGEPKGGKPNEISQKAGCTGCN